MSECDGAEYEAGDHDGNGVEQNFTSTDAIDGDEGDERKEEVCCCDGEGC